MNKVQADICLLAVTLCWSCEIIMHAIIPEGVNPFATVCVTSLIGAIVLWGYFGGKIKNAFLRDGVLLFRRVLFLSILDVAYNALFLVGLEYFDVPTGAFTASMTVVIIPIALFAMRRSVQPRAWFSAACVLAGVVLAALPSLALETAQGHAVMALGCLIRSIYIIKLNDYAREHDPIALASGISVICAALSFIPWFVMQPSTFLALPWTKELIAAYFVFGYFIVAFAGVLNIFAQRRASAFHSTIIYSTEILFTLIWTVLLPNYLVDAVTVSPYLIAGCALVVFGNIWEIIPTRKHKAEIDYSHDKAEDAITVASAHPLEILLRHFHSSVARKVILFAALLFVYVLLAVPFRTLSVIQGFTDIRPVCMLMPVYGIFFGMPGAFAFAVGNLIGDIASDSLRWSSIAGFVANFAYPYLMNLIWVKLRRKPFHLRTWRMLAGFAASLVLGGVVQAVIITPMVMFFYPEVDAMVFALSCLGNAIIFPLAFATPFIILIQEELGFTPLTRGKRFELGIPNKF